VIIAIVVFAVFIGVVIAHSYWTGNESLADSWPRVIRIYAKWFGLFLAIVMAFIVITDAIVDWKNLPIWFVPFGLTCIAVGLLIWKVAGASLRHGSDVSND